MTDAPTFTIGIEEEYLLVDRETRDLVADPPAEFLADCERSLGTNVNSEFLRCQVEVGTPVCKSTAEARAQLAGMRRTIAECAEKYGMAPIAASTHPFADWSRQHNTDKQRYNEIAQDLQVVARRLVICGMHVHVGIEDEHLRFDLFDQLTYFLPHLLALSASSPFWRGEITGLHSYRLSVFNEVPRTGLPPKFDNPAQYHRIVDTLTKAGEIEDATKLWWDLRPSARFPTIEMRITDVCPRLDDAIAIAALYRCVTRMLYRLRRANQRWRDYSTFLVNENRWLAQRFGATRTLIDFGKGEPVAFAALVDELLDLVAEDAAFFDCEVEIARARQIAAAGTSSTRQLAMYEARLNTGESNEAALQAVVDSLIAETLAEG